MSTTSSLSVPLRVSPFVCLRTPVGSLPVLGRPTSTDLLESQRPRRLDALVFLNLLMSTVGAGMLSLPFTFAVLPPSAAVAMLLVVGLFMALTAHALLCAHAQAAEKDERFAGAHLASYRAMGIRVGRQRFGSVVSVVMAVGIFGSCVGTIRITRDMMPHMCKLLYDAVYDYAYADLPPRDQTSTELTLLLSLFFAVVFPLCTLKSLSSLKIPNCFALLCSVLLVLVVVYRGMSSGSTHPTPSSTPVPPVSFSRFTQSVSIYSYAFTMHLNLMPLFVQLRRDGTVPVSSAKTAMTHCIVGVTGLCMLLYVVFGFFAARLYGSSTQGNVLVNMQADPSMQLPLIAVFIAVLLSFPPLFHPGRVIVEELCTNRSACELSWRMRVLTAALLLIMELIVAVFVPGIEVIFALVGASTTVLICYVFPVSMFTQLYPWQTHGKWGVSWCLFLWLIVILVAAMGLRTTLFLLSNR